MKKNKAKHFKKMSFQKSYWIILIFLITILFFCYKLFCKQTKTIKTSSENTLSTNDILSECSQNESNYSSKKFDNLDYLYIDNLFLKYENNITLIKFNLYNDSNATQDSLNFNFSLLDENNTLLITYDLKLSEPLKGNQNKEFILISTRDVSNASDYKIEIKK